MALKFDCSPAISTHGSAIGRMLKDGRAEIPVGDMSRDTDTPPESRVTTDREQIERWAREHDATPVRRERGGEHVVELVPESERRSTHEEMTWDEFHEELDRGDMLVAYREDAGTFDVLGRDEMVSRHKVDVADVESAHHEGETVTATITETTVIEQTIVEEATLESEIVDRATVEETFVDAELITREVDHCEVSDVQGADTVTDEAAFEPGYESEDTVMVEVEVDEGWTVTKEHLDRLTIETRVVDTEATETDTIESDTFEETIDVEGVQRTILEGDLLESQEHAANVIESGSIESEFREGDVIETTLLERSTVEEELSVRKEFSGEIGNGRTVAADTISRQTVESEIAADEDLEAVVVDEGAVTGETTMEETAVEDETATGTETVDETPGEFEGDHPMPTEAEEGKTVVDATGEEVGMVVEVDAGTVYVDPHPSLTDRIRAVLDWGGRDEDAYPLDRDHIARITDDEVQLTVEEESER